MSLVDKKYFFPITLCLMMIICSCQSLIQALDEAEYNEVETLYTKGLKAKKAQDWEQAYRFFSRAYKSSKTKGGILRFPDQPRKNNYMYTYALIGRKMEAVAQYLDEATIKKIIKEEKLGNIQELTGASMGDRQTNIKQNMQQGIFEKVQKARSLFAEAEELARREKYVEAIALLEKYIEEDRTSGEADQARKLIGEYREQLNERRKEIYKAVGTYLKKNDYAMAKDLLLKMKQTYPQKPAFEDALAYIDKFLKDIEEEEREYNKKLQAERQQGQSPKQQPMER
jgi:outer membrane protein assembly factor BamD (BamD/ComL family)